MCQLIESLNIASMIGNLHQNTQIWVINNEREWQKWTFDLKIEKIFDINDN